MHFLSCASMSFQNSYQVVPSIFYILITFQCGWKCCTNFIFKCCFYPIFKCDACVLLTCRLKREGCCIVQLVSQTEFAVFQLCRFIVFPLFRLFRYPRNWIYLTEILEKSRNISLQNEPPQDNKTNKMTCAQRRLRSALASAHSEQESSLSA